MYLKPVGVFKETKKIARQQTKFGSLEAATENNSAHLTLYRMGCFGVAHGWGVEAKRPPVAKICHTYPAMMKLGTVISYPKKIQKIYESRDTPLEFC